MSGFGNAQVGRGKLRPCMFRAVYVPGIGPLLDRQLTPWHYLEASRWLKDRGHHGLAGPWADTHRRIVWSQPCRER